MANYFSRKPDDAEKLFQFALEYDGTTFSWHSSSGVFQQRDLDDGTRLLLDTTRDLPGRTVLDLGCGHGPLGLLALRHRPDALACLLDVNPRACRAAAKNLRQLRARAVVIQADGARALGSQRFDLVLTNPPIRTGLETLRRLFEEAGEAMTPDGILAFVCRPKQGGRRLATIASEILGAEAEKLGRNKGFESFCLRRRPPA